MKAPSNEVQEEGDKGVGGPNKLLQKLLHDNAIIGAMLGVLPRPKSAASTSSCGGGGGVESLPCQEEVLMEIAASTDMEALLDGIAQDMTLVLSPKQDKGEREDGKGLEMNDRTEIQEDGASDATNVVVDIVGAVDSNAKEITVMEGPGEGDDTEGDDQGIPQPKESQASLVVHEEPFYETTLAARLSRIKCLLYKERTMASATSSSSTLHKQLSFSRKQPPTKRHIFPQLHPPSSSHAARKSSPKRQHSPPKAMPKLITVASAVLHSLLQSKEREQLIPTLLCHLHKLPFEARKDVASIFNHLLVCGCVHSSGGGNSGGGGSTNTSGRGTEFWGNKDGINTESEETMTSYVETMFGFVSYIEDHYASIISPIVVGHYMGPPAESASTTGTMITPDIALLCGSMLRSTLRHPTLYALLLSSEYAPRFVYPFLDYMINQPNFEVASDALETFRLMMTGGGVAVVPMQVSHATNYVTDPAELEAYMESIVATFLEREYQAIFMERFNRKLLNVQTANYITRRVSLQLLSAILLTRSNYSVMIQYISNRSNLIAIMILLRDASAHITLDAFHVFKIFVANPNKPPEIVRILTENKVKLIKYLGGLHKEREENDEQFRDEKTLVLATLEAL